MLESIERNIEPLTSLKETNGTIADLMEGIDWSLVKNLIALLEPFRETRCLLCEETAPTFHLVLPSKAKLVTNSSVKHSDSFVIRELKKRMKNFIEFYFTISPYHPYHATLLVSMFRGL